MNVRYASVLDCVEHQTQSTALPVYAFASARLDRISASLLFINLLLSFPLIESQNHLESLSSTAIALSRMAARLVPAFVALSTLLVPSVLSYPSNNGDVSRNWPFPGIRNPAEASALSTCRYWTGQGDRIAYQVTVKLHYKEGWWGACAKKFETGVREYCKIATGQEVEWYFIESNSNGICDIKLQVPSLECIRAMNCLNPEAKMDECMPVCCLDVYTGSSTMTYNGAVFASIGSFTYLSDRPMNSMELLGWMIQKTY